MYPYEVPRTGVETQALDAALRGSLGGAISGISTGNGKVQVWFFDQPTPVQEANALAAIAQHDPAFLSADKSTIANDGQDAATITISLPHTQAQQVIATVNGVAFPALPVTGGSASLQVTADDTFSDGDTLTIGVQAHPYTPLTIGVTDGS
jgi:hypothetical protein